MNRRMLLAGSLRILTRYKLRSFLMSLGIVVGVAALVVMRSLGSGAEQDMMSKIERMFTASSIMIMNGAQASRHGIVNPGKLSIEDVEALAAQLDQITDWDASVAVRNRDVQFRDRSRSVMLVGHSERAQSVWNRGVIEGEFFSKADINSANRVVLIGGKVAGELFGDQDPVGERIRIDGQPFRVKGVLESQGFDPHGLDRDNEIHIPITTMMKRVLKREVIGNAKLIVSETANLDDTVEEIAEILRGRHDLADEEPDDFSLFTPTQVQRAVKKANRVLTVYLPATAGIALLVAAMVIVNIMLMGVRERIAEIGLRKAVGATDRQIGGQFLLESLAVAGASGTLGTLLGVGIVQAISSHFVPETRIAADAVLIGPAAALVVGVLAGFLPARRAALQEPVDALK